MQYCGFGLALDCWTWSLHLRELGGIEVELIIHRNDRNDRNTVGYSNGNTLDSQPEIESFTYYPFGPVLDFQYSRFYFQGVLLKFSVLTRIRIFLLWILYSVILVTF